MPATVAAQGRASGAHDPEKSNVLQDYPGAFGGVKAAPDMRCSHRTRPIRRKRRTSPVESRESSAQETAARAPCRLTTMRTVCAFAPRSHYECAALPTELIRHVAVCCSSMNPSDQGFRSLG